MRKSLYGLSVAFFISGVAPAQTPAFGPAYRVLGQKDTSHNGVNLLQGVELQGPAGLALDARDGQLHIYVADTGNSRILAWQDARSYQMGDAPAMVLGQSDASQSAPLGIGVKGLSSPMGLAVDPGTGNLYVADTGNHRVVRFPAPFSNLGRVEPDTVYGQPSFTVRTANTSGIGRASMNGPRAVAVDSSGNLWVADTGNHRVLRFNASVLESLTPPSADLVIGQRDFASGAANHNGLGVTASGFDQPAGLAFDAQGNLYVADFNNARVLKFAGSFSSATTDPAAASVIGQASFTARVTTALPSASTLVGPVGLSVDGSGNLYVAVPGENRILMFPASAGSATVVLGQPDLSSVTANANAYPQASASSLSGVTDVKIDSSGNVYAADTGNHRVLYFPAGSKSAARVWGQIEFTANGANQVEAASLNNPFKIAIDYSRVPYALYVSDTANHRVLVWKDAVRFRTGDPADLVIGQPDLRTAAPNTDTRSGRSPSKTSLYSPKGIVVDGNGTLYVADSGNNRVLRYAQPLSQYGRIEPDVVLGQSSFTTSNSAAVNAHSLSNPVALALGPDGNLFVSDSGNHRVLEFPAGAASGSAAVRVYGQPSFYSAVQSGSVSAQTLNAPGGLFVDSAFNLYVADSGSNRVLVFPNTQSAPTAGTPAAYVLGQSRFDSTSATGSGALRNPSDVMLDLWGNIYVSDTGNHRVLIYSSFVFLPSAGATPSAVVGQRDLIGVTANWNGSSGLGTPEGLSSPAGIYLDRQDTLYVADAGNSRVAHFLKSANVVNAAHLLTSYPIAQGSLAILSGTGLAEREEQSVAAPWQTSLAGREVIFNDEIKAPVSQVTATQAAFQVPSSSMVGSNRVAVRLAETGELIAGGTVLVAATAPGLFSTAGDGRGQARATNQDGKANSTSEPAVRGSTLSLFGTGQGAVSPAVPDGNAAPSEGTVATVAVPTADSRTCLSRQPSVCVAVGTAFAEIQFSGLAPSAVGVWQLKIKVPLEIQAGDAVAVRAIINGTATNTVTVAIR